MTDNDAAAFAAGIYPDVPAELTTTRRFGPPGSVSSTEIGASIARPLTSGRKRTRRPRSRLGHTVHGMVLRRLDTTSTTTTAYAIKRREGSIIAAARRGQVPMSRADYARAEDTYQAVILTPAAAAPAWHRARPAIDLTA